MDGDFAVAAEPPTDLESTSDLEPASAERLPADEELAAAEKPSVARKSTAATKSTATKSTATTKSTTTAKSTAARSRAAAKSTAAKSTAAGKHAADGETRREYRVEALAKGLRLLGLFTEQRPTWRITDLAVTLDLPVATTFRVVQTLASEGYLDHLPSGDYRPGVRALTLGTAALRSLDLVELAGPRLQRLAARTGETVNLAVLNADRVLYLVRIRNSDLVTANIQVGSTLPAVHTSIGKLLLAYLDENDLRHRITEASFPAQRGPNAKVSLDELGDELARIREQGWATQDEELAYGLRSVAGPIIGPDGRVVAGVNVAVQARDWSAQRIVRELRPVVLEVCTEISQLVAGS